MSGRLMEKYRSLPVQVKASFWSLICGVLQRGISIIVTPIFTRLMNPAEYGDFGNFGSWSELLGIVLTLRLYYGVFMQGLVRYDDNQDQYTSSLIGLVLLLELAGMLLYFPFRGYWNGVTGLSTSMMICIFPLTWLGSLFSFWQTRQRIVYRYRALVALTLAMSVFQPASGIAAVTLFPSHKAEARVISMTLVQCACFAWIFLMYWYRGRKLYVRRHWIHALKFNVPLVPHYLSQSVLSISDRIMIRNLVSSAAAGIYNLSYSLSFVMTIFNQALLNTLNPWIYQQIKAKNYTSLSRVSYLALACVAAVNLLVVAAAPEVIRLFAPPAYQEGVWLVPPLAGTVVVTFMYSLFADFEFYYERTDLVMWGSLVGAVLNVGLNWILIPALGYQIAAWTTLVGYMAYVSMHYVFMRKVQKSEMDGIKVYDLRIIVGILVAFAVFAMLLITLYPVPIIRYVACLLGLSFTIVKRKWLLRMWSDLRRP